MIRYCSNQDILLHSGKHASAFVDTPLQVLGIPNQSEKDEIVKSVMHLKNAEIEEGYTMDAVVSRQNLLMDVRDKLLFEPEYAGNIKDKVLPKSSLRIPWTWLPGALCLLQEVLGIPNQSEKDEIVKSVMHLKNAEIEEGYTMDAVVSRQNLLMDVRDKLLFEPEYAGNIKDKVLPKSSLRIPWTWLPGALCLLQEVGEEKLVLDIGRRALQNPDAKAYIHDLLLSMALAECAIAKLGFEKNNISQGFEALARAQCLLRSKISLGKMTLLSQIEESLEELAPACTLELLGMPHTPENAERRLGAIAALRELLRQGLDVETSCQVQDWPCFLNQALKKLMAMEMVELLPWDNLAMTRKNKKSLESQNQRVVIDFNCFYVVLIAHIALGFSSKQTDLVMLFRILDLNP
ncbi:unnamed protein product [Ilex paraguariensis]|uniref:Plastid division protein CDP1-like 1st alpha solenoid domain-containing protein n=1 Tax=Ilex paraguariensis TaxID=185542 RepID=A0ABC8UX32_9AQUA